MRLLCFSLFVLFFFFSFLNYLRLEIVIYICLLLIIILQAEVNYLGELIHPHLVKLIGYCIEDNQRVLVYEFMPRGSLENHLFKSMYSNACLNANLSTLL